MAGGSPVVYRAPGGGDDGDGGRGGDYGHLLKGEVHHEIPMGIVKYVVFRRVRETLLRDYHAFSVMC